MTEDEQVSKQGKWFLAWWGLLPTYQMTGNHKGSRQEAWLEWKKLSPDRDLCATIGEYTKEREAANKQLMDTGKTVPKWKNAVRLIKYKFWEDDLPAVKPDRQKGYAGACACGQDVDHGGYGMCWSCVDAKYGDTLTNHGVQL